MPSRHNLKHFCLAHSCWILLTLFRIFNRLDLSQITNRWRALSVSTPALGRSLRERTKWRWVYFLSSVNQIIVKYLSLKIHQHWFVRSLKERMAISPKEQTHSTIRLTCSNLSYLGSSRISRLNWIRITISITMQSLRPISSSLSKT